MLMLFINIAVTAVFTLIVYGAYMLIISFTVWMAVDAAKQDRFWWVLLTLAIPFIGPLVYYYTEKKHEYGKIEPHHVHPSQTEDQHEHAPKKKSHKGKASVAKVDAVETKEETKEAPSEEAKDLAGIDGLPAETTKPTEA